MNKDTGSILVSVCMITYNHQDFIKSAINGVLYQETDFDYELIISNDNSSDKTHEIISDIIGNHPKKYLVKYYNNTKNLGMMPNFINTLKKCKGDYIAICDGDDYWIDNKKLQLQVGFLKSNTKYNLVYTLKKNLLPNGNFNANNSTISIARTTSLDDLIAENYICASTTLFKNKLIGLNFSKWYYSSPYGDWPLYMYLLQNGEKIFCLDKVTTVYRKNVGITTGVTNNALKSLRNQLLVFNGMLLDKNYYGIHSKISKRIYTLNVNLMSAYNKDRQFFKSMKSFINLLIEYPNYFEFKLVKDYIKSLLKGVKIIK